MKENALINNSYIMGKKYLNYRQMDILGLGLCSVIQNT